MDWGGGDPTASGERVNHANALKLAAVWACIRCRAESFAALPFQVRERLGENESAQVNEHPAADILRIRPNASSSPITLKETIQAHVDTWGAGFLEIKRAAGEIVAIEPLLPDRTRPVRSGENVYFLHNADPAKIDPRSVPGRDVIHVPGLGFDGLDSYSVIDTHKEAIGAGKAVRAYGSRWFGKGAKPAGVLTMPGRVKDAVAEGVAERFERLHGGSNSHGVAVLGGGATWNQIGLPPDDSQFIETQDAGTLEICRIFRVPPHKIGYLKDAGDRANVEQENRSFLTDVLLSIILRWEQELNYKMFTGAERGRLFVKANVNAILRGDFKTRMEGYRIGREMGVWNADEIRALEEENPLPKDSGGSIYYAPMNMTPLEDLGKEPEPAAPFRDDRSFQRPSPLIDKNDRSHETRALRLRKRIQSSNAGLIEDVGRRIVRRETEQISRRIKRSKRATAEELESFLETFYEELRSLVSRTALPVLMAFAEQIGEVAAEEAGASPVELENMARRYAASMAARYTDGHLGQLKSLIENTPEEDRTAVLAQRLEEWTERAPGKLAARESVQAGSAFAKATWLAVGVQTLRWVTFGPCPLCKPLSGKRVGISESFVSSGEVIDPGGGVSPLRASQNHGHPPLHGGCECSIVPG